MKMGCLSKLCRSFPLLIEKFWSCKQDEYIDLIIPRGGEGLIRFVSENSTIPVLKHYKGVCQYIDEHADMDMAKILLLILKFKDRGFVMQLKHYLFIKIYRTIFTININKYTGNKVEIKVFKKNTEGGALKLLNKTGMKNILIW